MRVRYIGKNGKNSVEDSSVTIGKIYNVVRIEKSGAYPVVIVSDNNTRQHMSWDVLEKVEEGIMRVVANWTDDDGSFTKGNIYNLTEFGCEDNDEYNYTLFLNENEGTLIEKWNKCYMEELHGIFTEVKKDTMKKSDLVTGLHAVELRSGSFYIVVGDQLLSNYGWMRLKKYDENLERIKSTIFIPNIEKLDIVKIYKHKKNFKECLGGGFKGLTKTEYDLLWERETEQQKRIKELKKIIEDAANKIREIEGE